MQTKRVGGVDISLAEVEYDGDVYIFCPCHDAECFGEDSLRLLLCSGDGSNIRGVIAFSSTDGRLQIRALTLD